MENQKRQNEQAFIINRNKFEQCPTGVDENEWKIFRENYNNAAKLIHTENPSQIDIELNSNCNLKCTFCIQSVVKIKTVRFEFDQFKKIIDECKSLKIRSLKLNYQNEPLLRKDLYEYITYAKNNGFINIFFSSNGILLNDENVKKLIDAGITKIFISLDSFKNETYKKLRGQDELENIKNNILNFLKVRKDRGLLYPLIRLNFLKTSENINELDDFVEFWKDKVDFINIQDMNELIDNQTDLYIKKEGEYKCAMPFKQIVVTASGDLLPCCTMHGIKHKIGHISQMSIKEAWHSEKMKYLRNLHENGKINEDSICKKCIYGK